MKPSRAFLRNRARLRGDPAPRDLVTQALLRHGLARSFFTTRRTRHDAREFAGACDAIRERFPGDLGEALVASAVRRHGASCRRALRARAR